MNRSHRLRAVAAWLLCGVAVVLLFFTAFPQPAERVGAQPDWLTTFGVGAVSTMVVAYTLESRSPACVLVFAAACAASSAYGFLAGTWPFGIAEAIWAGIALRRWAERTDTPPAATI